VLKAFGVFLIFSYNFLIVGVNTALYIYNENKKENNLKGELK
jgi:hypothetical protein